MAIQRINIDQQLAEIGVRTTRAGLRISNNRGQIRIKNVRPELNIERQAPSFKVNKKKQNSESGLKSPLEVTQKFRNEGRAAAIRAVGQAKDDGNFLGALNRPPADKVPLLAKNKANARLGPKETNIALMPASPAEIDWEKGKIEMNWSKHSVQIDFEGKNTADVSLDPKHSVEVYLRTRPYFRVSVVEAVPSSGRYINSAV